MDKTQIFMILTSVISVICFNFNKVLDYIISLVSENIYDESVYIYGPYYKYKPITIDLVMIDEKIYTNKFRLLMNWKWNFDLSGFVTSDVLLLKTKPHNMIIKYRKKQSQDSSPVVCKVDFINSTVDFDNMVKDIVFEEIPLHI